ncbi:MAG: lysophospholipid acyltransferase family protein [Candidatus Zixiibacteriota bacterium]
MSKTTGYKIEYFFFWCLTQMARLLSDRMADGMAVLLGKVAYYILASRRRIALDNLRKAFQDEKSEEEYQNIARNVFVNMARSIVEFIRMPLLSKEKIMRIIPEHIGSEYLDETLKKGRGGLVVSAHIGNWELLGARIAAAEYPSDFLVGRQHNQYVDNALLKIRGVTGATIISVGVSSRHVLKSLQENRLVILAADQHSATGAVITEFFGRPAATHKGPAAFASKMNCPLIFGCLIRERYDRFRLITEAPLYSGKSGDQEKDIQAMMQAYSDWLEKIVRQYPEQWMWTHRRWKVDNK